MAFVFKKSKRIEPLPPALYPFRGMMHLAHHPKRVAGPIVVSAIKAGILSLIAIIPIVKYGFGPQARFLSRLYMAFAPQNQKQWLANTGMAITGAILCIIESVAVAGQINNRLVGSLDERFFDVVLMERNGLPPPKATTSTSINTEEMMRTLNVAVEQARDKIPSSVQEAQAKAAELGKQVQKNIPTLDEAALQVRHLLEPRNIMFVSAQSSKTWSSYLLAPTLFVVTLPLNIIPVVGPISFAAIQGLSRGGRAHKRYFDLFEWSDKRRQQRIESAFWDYHAFGTTAAVLETIPFLGFLFAYTNQIGAAMWVMDLKEANKLEDRKFFKIF